MDGWMFITPGSRWRVAEPSAGSAALRCVSTLSRICASFQVLATLNLPSHTDQSGAPLLHRAQKSAPLHACV